MGNEAAGERKVESPILRVSAIPGWHSELIQSHQAGPTPSSGGSFGMVNHGGPVIGCPQIYAGFWGQQWYRDSGYQALASQIAQFLADLPDSTFFNVLSQYGVGGGAGLAGAFFQSHTLAITGRLSDQDVQNWTQILIDTGNLPPASPPGSLGVIVFMIFLDETIGVDAPTLDGGITLCFPDAAQPYTPKDFGYHNFFTTSAGNPMYYGVVASVSDGCLQETCAGDDSQCSLHLSQSQQQRMTQVASHELAEICTDPQLNAWYSVLGEIGDICNGESDTVTVSGRTWTVQKVYSLATDISTNGSTVCIASAPQPLAMVSGAAPADLAPIAGRRPGHLDRILPLPILHVDPETRTAQVDKRHLRRYINRLMLPLRSSHLFAGLPGMLREAADILEQSPRSGPLPRQTGPSHGVPATKHRPPEMPKKK